MFPDSHDTDTPTAAFVLRFPFKGSYSGSGFELQVCNGILSSPGISWSGLVFGSAGFTCSFVGTNTLTYDVLVEFNAQTDLGAQTIERLVTHNVAILFSLDFLNENAVPEVVPVSKLMPPRPPPPPLPTSDEDEKEEDGGSGAPSVEPGPASQPPPTSVVDNPVPPPPPSQCGSPLGCGDTGSIPQMPSEPPPPSPPVFDFSEGYERVPFSIVADIEYLRDVIGSLFQCTEACESSSECLGVLRASGAQDNEVALCKLLPALAPVVQSDTWHMYVPTKGQEQEEGAEPIEPDYATEEGSTDDSELPTLSDPPPPPEVILQPSPPPPMEEADESALLPPPPPLQQEELLPPPPPPPPPLSRLPPPPPPLPSAGLGIFVLGSLGSLIEIAEKTEITSGFKFLPVVDTERPTIRLLGTGHVLWGTAAQSIDRMVHYVPLGGQWEDPGVAIQDNLDPYLNRTHAWLYGGEVDTSHPTLPDAPILLTYSVTDSSGNEALPVGRLIHVVCPNNEPACPDYPHPACGIWGSCKAAGSGLDEILSSQPNYGSLKAIPEPQSECPQLFTVLLNGPSVLTRTVGSPPYAACGPSAAPGDDCDPGAAAYSGPCDSIGSLTSFIEVSCGLGPGHRSKRRCTSLGATEVGMFSIDYSVRPNDAARSDEVLASAVRTVWVVPDCDAAEHLCRSNTTCSVGGVCFEMDESQSIELPGSFIEPVITETEGPKLVLRGPSTMSLTQHAVFEACDGVEDDPSDPCEPPPAAFDAEGRDISDRIVTIPTDAVGIDCAATRCTGYEYSSVGIAPAALNTSSPVGTAFTIKYVVVDSLARAATAERTVVIIEPCDNGMTWCRGACWPVGSCDLLDALVPADPIYMPTVKFIGSEHIVMRYGESLSDSKPGSLEPCLTSLDYAEQNCGAALLDASTGDLLIDIGTTLAVIEVVPDDDCQACARCSPKMLTLRPSPCLPGTYMYRYVVVTGTDVPSDGNLIKALRTVTITNADALILDIPVEIPDLSMPESLIAHGRDQNLALRVDALISISSVWRATRIEDVVVKAAWVADDGSMWARVSVFIPADAVVPSDEPEVASRRLLQQDGWDKLTKTAGIVVVGVEKAKPVSYYSGKLATAASSLQYSDTAAEIGQAYASAMGVSVPAAAGQYDVEASSTEAQGSLLRELLEDAAAGQAALEAALSGLSRGLDEARAASMSMDEGTNALIRSMEEYSAIAERQIADTAFFMTFLESDDEQSSCEAERHATNNYTVTFETGSRAVSSSVRRRRQLLKAKGVTSDSEEGKAVWAGYDLGGVLDKLRFDEYGENVTELRKFLGPNKRANRLLGGMLLHQVRGAYRSESACDIRHPELSAACAHKLRADRAMHMAMNGNASSSNIGHSLILDEWNDPLTPFGADPVFQVGKELYNPRLAGREGEFYNMTASSEDVGVTGWPRPFHPRPLEGRETGFPVVVPTTSDRAGAAKMLGALEEGSFLDPLSRELNIDLVSYNHFANLLSYSSSVVVWDRAGQILLKNTLIRILPVFSSQSSGDAMIIPLLLALLSLAYLLLSDLPSIVGSGVRRAVAAFSCRRRSHRWQYFPDGNVSNATRRKISAMEVAFDILVLGMLVAGLVLNLVASNHSMSLSPRTSYRVYDTPGIPAARYFLRAKQLGDAEQEGIDLGSVDPRWMEENDNSGLEAFGGLVHSIRMGSAQYLVSGVILALALVMAILRSVHLWSFKIELGLVFEVMVKVVPDIAHLMVVMAFAMFGLAAAGNVLLGPELEEVSTPLKSFYFLFQVFLIGDLGAFPTVVRDSREDRSAIMDAAAHAFLGVVPMLLCFVFFQFFVAIILEKFYSCKFELGSSGNEATKTNDRHLVEAAEAFGLRFRIGKGGSIKYSSRTRDVLARLQQSSPAVGDRITEFDVEAIKRLRTSFKHEEEGNQLLSTLKTNFGHEAEDLSTKLIKKMNLWGGAGQATIMKMLQGTKKSPAGASGYLSEVNQHLDLALKQVMILNAAIEEAAAMSEALFAKEIECKWLFKLVAANGVDSIPLPMQDSQSFSCGLPGQPLEVRRKTCLAKNLSSMPQAPPLHTLLNETNRQPSMARNAPLCGQGRRVTIGATELMSIPVDGPPQQRAGFAARPANKHKKRISSSAVPDRPYSTVSPFSRKSADSQDSPIVDLDNGSQREQGPVSVTSSYSGPTGPTRNQLMQQPSSSRASVFRTPPESPQERSFTAQARSLETPPLETFPLDWEVASSHHGHGEASRPGAYPRAPNTYMPPRRRSGSMI